MTDELIINELECAYGAIRAVKGVTMRVSPGELVALLGSNGAGKSTTLKSIAGLMRPAGGQVTVDGHNLTGRRAHTMISAGVALVPEGRHVCAFLSVQENLELSLVGPARKRRARTSAIEIDEVYELFPVLGERSQQLAGSLSGGEQQMLAIGRALLTAPSYLLLDEPSMGLAPIVVDTVVERLHSIRERGIAMLLVEQNAEVALSLADRVYVMQRGVIVGSGVPSELGASALSEAYLG